LWEFSAAFGCGPVIGQGVSNTPPMFLKTIYNKIVTREPHDEEP
jgi:hypothetical protein